MSFVAIGFTPCSKSSSGPIIQNLNIAQETLGQTMDVTFKAGPSGNGTITTPTFTIGGKDNTLNNPSLHWSYTASILNSNDAVSRQQREPFQMALLKFL